ncbi:MULTISPECIES: DUF997 family protein [unclassified Halomonas]|uniref:DUF997 family protein n=1 Tax=unclassified Halomonas TaxID=2609666 RepID=UPI000C937805|nr:MULTISPECIES: DUF997 family protein [unclassified Halomonas]MAR71993.1 hypothetical protein [Halomonas sp.]|tara:strand:+ start:3248 stop:3511 length:264 start_codon:yes stop_codon:yes gene_type:complete
MSESSDSKMGRAYYMRTRREAMVAGIIWIVFLVWTVGVSYILGYRNNDLSTTMGIPTWIFWGVLVPFYVAALTNSIYAFFYLQDDPE